MSQPANSLLLADGTLLENSSCGASSRDLWCWVSGRTMAECLTIFSDSEKTGVITAGYKTSHVIYTGYTELLGISRNNDPLELGIRIRLTWPENGEHSIIEVNDLNTLPENEDIEEQN